MRVALAQLNVVVGDLDGNVGRISSAVEEAKRAAADLVVLPELAVTGYPPEDLLLRPGFIRAAREAVDEVARGCDGIVALVGRPGVRPRPRERRVRVRGRRRAGRLPQAVPPELRRLRRAPLLRARPRAPAAPARRRAGRPDDLRGRLAARPPGHRSRARRRDAPRQPLGVALPRREGGGPRGDARHAGPGQRRLHRVLQPRRGAGRARLRRPLGRPRRRGRGRRTRARLRGGAARRRRRPDRGDRPAPTRRPAPRARAIARRRARRDDARAGPGARGLGARRGHGDAVRPGARAAADGPRAGAPRLRREERLPGRRHLDLGRHRLGAHGRDRGRRAGGRARPHRLDAVALLVATRPATTPAR